MLALTVYAVFALFAIWVCAAVALRPVTPGALIAAGAHALSVATIATAALTPGVYFSATGALGDLWTALEQINKIDYGIRSNLDYYNPIGPIYEWAMAAALALRPASASTLCLANAIVGAAVLVLTVLALRGRASSFTVGLVGLISVTAAVSPRELDSLFVEQQASFLAPYNRWGWAFFTPVMVRFALPPGDRADTLGSVAAGVLIAAMVLIKASYGAAALGMAAVAAVLRPGGLRDAIVAGAAAGLALVAADASTGQLLPYVSDLRETAMQPHSRLRWIKLINQVAEAGLAWLVSVAILYAGAARAGVTGPPVLSAAFLRPAALLAAVGGAGWVVLMQNHYATEPAVYLAMPLIAAEWSGLLRPGEAGARAPAALRLRNALLLLLVLIVATRPVADAGFVAAQPVELARRGYDRSLADTPMADLSVRPAYRGRGCADPVCQDYAALFSGLSLLREAGADAPGAGTVLALSFSNPFPFALDRPSPPGSPIWTHVGRSISRFQHPRAEAMFDTVEFVLISRDGYNGEILSRIYADYLGRNFVETDRNRDWRLLVRGG